MPSIDSNTKYNPENIVKKQARGSDGDHLGEIKEISQDYVIIQKSTIDKDKFYFGYVKSCFLLSSSLGPW
jgi:hypothetical protein